MEKEGEVTLSLTTDEALLLWAFFWRGDIKHEISYASVGEYLATQALTHRLNASESFKAAFSPLSRDPERYEKVLAEIAANYAESYRGKVPEDWFTAFPRNARAEMSAVKLAVDIKPATSPSELGYLLACIAENAVKFHFTTFGHVPAKQAWTEMLESFSAAVIKKNGSHDT